jgi:hypothetical protein
MQVMHAEFVVILAAEVLETPKTTYDTTHFGVSALAAWRSGETPQLPRLSPWHA